MDDERNRREKQKLLNDLENYDTMLRDLY